MVYNDAKPGVNDDLSVSQGDIQGNFAQANTSIGVDHFDFENVAGDTGKHKYTTFVDIDSTTPVTASPVTTANELAFFVKKVGSDPRIHFRQISNGTEVQLTGDDPILSSIGETTVIGGLIIKWGTGTIATANTNTDFTFSIAFPTACFNVQLTPLSGTSVSTPQLVSIAADKFVARTSIATFPLTVYWIAIGV